MAAHASPSRIAHRPNGYCAIVVVLVCTLVLLACGGEESAPVANEPPPVDPRFASAEALIEHFKALNANPNLGYREELDLYYAETDLQRRILGALEYHTYADDLNKASIEQFGEAFDPSFELFPETAELTSIDGRRATAVATVIASGERRDLHLVEIDRRWWLSGYTFEYDEDFTDPEGIAFFEQLTTQLRDTVPRIISRIRSGEFDNVDEARGAILVEAMTEALKQFGAEENGVR